MLYPKKFLVGDIGGTNTRLAIIDDAYTVLSRKLYINSEIGSLDNAIKDFLSSNTQRIEKACFAVAGPLNADRTQCRLGNIEWIIDAQALKDLLKVKEVLLLNDFEALGLSIDLMDKAQYIELTNKGFNDKGTITLIGAGTGLGMSILYEVRSKHYPLPSEGGSMHIPFDYSNKLEVELYQYLKKKKVLLRAESLLSGRGLVDIYEFLMTKKVRHDKKVMEMIKKAKSGDKPALITKYALDDKDFLCEKTLNMFMIYYARVARDVALISLCSTLVIAGGIAPKILSALQDGFVEMFYQHDYVEARKILEDISIIVINEPEIALKGCVRAIMLK